MATINPYRFYTYKRGPEALPRLVVAWMPSPTCEGRWFVLEPEVTGSAPAWYIQVLDGSALRPATPEEQAHALRRGYDRLPSWATGQEGGADG